MFRKVLLIALVASTALAALTPAHAVADGPAAQIALRVGPTGFVVPSHWAVGNPSLWLVDPLHTTAFNGLSGVAGCLLDVSDASGDGRIDGIEVLNAASGGCISGWSGEDQGFGVFVTSVDGLDAIGWPASYWYIQVNGLASNVGVSDMSLGDGDSLDFVYFGGPL